MKRPEGSRNYCARPQKGAEERREGQHANKVSASKSVVDKRRRRLRQAGSMEGGSKCGARPRERDRSVCKTKPAGRVSWCTVQAPKSRRVVRELGSWFGSRRAGVGGRGGRDGQQALWCRPLEPGDRCACLGVQLTSTALVQIVDGLLFKHKRSVDCVPRDAVPARNVKKPGVAMFFGTRKGVLGTNCAVE